VRVLVTGGAGYIGSHTVRHLLSLGHRVVVLDLDAIPAAGVLEGARGVVGDVRDTTSLANLLREEQVDAVVHFAGLRSVAESMRDPGSYFDTNVIGSLSVARAMVDAGTSLIVFSSSCSVYGTAARLPADESSPLQPESAYAASKMLAEQMLGWFGRVHGIRVVSLRYFNAAGASFDTRLGEDWDRSKMLIPMLIKAALGKRDPVEIFGTDYPTPDGTAIRDYIHVMDLADAHALALEHGRSESSAPFVALNLGTGVGSSVREVIALVEEVAGRAVPTRWSERRPGDPAQVWADATLARSTLGWQARHDLRAMVTTAWTWHSRDLDDSGRVRR
jgi:UDP-glucose-4-epimerase GalE